MSTKTWLPCVIIMLTLPLVHANLLALVYPVVLFTWGMLQSPEPGWRFWMAMILYTAGQIVARYAFQFSFWGAFNRPRTQDFECEDAFLSADCVSFARLVGIERYNDLPEVRGVGAPQVEPQPLNGFVLDLLLLFFLCTHKIIMERRGAWR